MAAVTRSRDALLPARGRGAVAREPDRARTDPLSLRPAAPRADTRRESLLPGAAREPGGDGSALPRGSLDLRGLAATFGAQRCAGVSDAAAQGRYGSDRPAHRQAMGGIGRA